jgi:hypothetical protein
VKKLFEELSKSADGICRLYHDAVNGRYWNVMEYTDLNNLQEVLICDELTNIQTLYKPKNNEENEYITQLEKLVSSMASQMNYLQKQLIESKEETAKAELMNTQWGLRNGELLCQLTEKDIEVTNVKQHFFKLSFDNQLLKSQLTDANQEINDLKNIINYVDNECLEMKTLLIEKKLGAELHI